ncbi:MAG: GH1 family beta-glucosidase [Myxococcota bacterium]
MPWHPFPDGFEWGAATAAYQIEGAAFSDGKGLSIWDVFSHQPGRVLTGDTGDVACDHYRLFRDDVALMAELGLQTYRLSVSWPRVIPFGAGEPNEAGLDFYGRLIDALLEAGIRPCITLYHWDLPQSLQDLGGWADRDTAKRFAEYGNLLFTRLGDRVERWITHNEPIVTAMAGHRVGLLAPGIRDLGITARTIHHLHLSHGLAIEAFRASGTRGEIGIANANRSLEPADDREETQVALERARDFEMRLFHGPVFGQGYPESVLQYYESKGAPFPIEAGDLDVIATPSDFLGVNLYSRGRIVPDPERGVGFGEAPPTLPLTDMGYEATPDALADFLRVAWKEYGPLPIYITENGVCDNTPLLDGAVKDNARVELLRGILTGLAGAIEEGIDVRAYYVWSLLDNFEWAFGFSRRFGIVWVDYESQKRTPKVSARFFRQVIERNGVES